jgi:hypothetical protein
MTAAARHISLGQYPDYGLHHDGVALSMVATISKYNLIVVLLKTIDHVFSQDFN